MFSALFKATPDQKKEGPKPKRGKRAEFLTSCVGLSDEDVECLDAMKSSATPIEHSTFVSNCNWRQLAKDLGYVVDSHVGLHMSEDWHVRYFKSTFKGKVCYYVVHSAIEYIFVRD